MAPVAAARRRRRPRRRPDHVRDRRRAAARRARARLAAGLRGLAAGAGRQRRLEQLQLDVYGEVLDALYQTRAHGAPADDNVWSLTRKLLDWLEDGLAARGRRDLGGARPEPALHALEGDGLGRVRPRRPLSTRSSAATGRSSAGARSATRSTPRCSSARWNEEKQAFTQSYGSDELDASVLLMPLVGFLPATDARFVSTVEAIRRELTVDGLVLRYRARGRRRRRAAGGRGRVPAVLVLARRRARPAGQARRGARAVRAAARPAQRRRPARRGVRPARRAASSATSRRRSPTSRS